MSITALVTNYIKFSGDQESELAWSSGDLEDSPAIQELHSLTSGNNTLTVPDVEDFTIHGVAIVPPAGNIIEITLKGASGDTGISLSETGVSLLRFPSTPPTEIVLNVSDDLAGMRLVWF